MVISVPLSKAFSASLICWRGAIQPGQRRRTLLELDLPALGEGDLRRRRGLPLERAPRAPSGGICELCMRPFSSTQV